MRVTADTNILVRAIVEDDQAQALVAQALLANSEVVALTLPTLCELSWVLTQSYRAPHSDVARSIRGLMQGRNVVVNRTAVEAGLKMLDQGGDFADGVIAFEGRSLGADVFASFDRKAVKLVIAQGEKARLLES